MRRRRGDDDREHDEPAMLDGEAQDAFEHGAPQ
jgi:hypothetical protein